MKQEKHTMLFTNPEIIPTDNAIENLLGKELYDVYHALLQIIAELEIQYDWRYYKDGKSWLFKAVSKKKTMFWLSIWEGFIKTSFYFTERNRSEIIDLPINDEIKKRFEKPEAIGKLIPLIIDIDSEQQLKDFQIIVRYKKNAK